MSDTSLLSVRDCISPNAALQSLERWRLPIRPVADAAFELRLGEQLLPLTAREQDGAMVFEWSGGGNERLSLETLAAFMTCDGLVQDWLQVFTDVRTVPLRGLSVSVGASNQVALQCVVGCEGGWNIIKDRAALESLQLTLGSRLEERHQGVPMVSGLLDARLTLGESFDVQLPLSGCDRWELRLRPRQGQVLPALERLAELTGGGEVVATLREGLARLGVEDLSVEAVRVGFDPAQVALRYVSATLAARIQGMAFQVSASLPDFTFYGALVEPQGVSLKGLLARSFPLPDAVPDVVLRDLSVSCDPAAGLYGFQGSAEGDWSLPLPAGSLALRRVEVELARGLGEVSGKLRTVTSVAGVPLELEAASPRAGEGWRFRGGLASGAELSLSALLDTFAPGAGLPPLGLPDLSFKEVSFEVEPGSGDFALTGAVTLSQLGPELSRFGLGAATLSLREARIELRRSGEGESRGISVLLHVDGSANLGVADGFDLEGFSFDFRYAPSTGWMLEGSAAARLLGASHTLAASLSRHEHTTTFTFAYRNDQAGPLLTLPGVAELHLGEVALSVTRSARPEDAAREHETAWTVSGQGGLTLHNVVPSAPAFRARGTLEVVSSAERKGLQLALEDSALSFALPLAAGGGGGSWDISLGLKRLALLREGTGGWGFEAEAGVKLSGLPPQVARVLASELKGSVQVNARGITLAAERVLAPLELPLPALQVAQGVELSPGLLVLDASNLRIQLGKTVALSVDLGVGLPEGLNAIFGTDAQHKPLMRFFNTYQPGQPDSVVRLRVGVDSETGLNVRLATSPIQAIRFDTVGEDTWCHADFGDFGALRFLVPVFSFDGTRFTARGGLEQLRPLKLPLAPLRMLLEAGHLDAAARALPTALPLEELRLLNADGTFAFDAFISTLERLGGFQLPSEVRDTLRVIGQRMDALPDRFKSYLDIQLPKEFHFDLSLTLDGGARGKVSVDEDAPIKVLFPSFGPLGPGLTGIELRSLTFGEMFSGALLLLSVDARVDQFDLLPLAGALMLPLERMQLAKNPRALGRRFIVKDLFMVIIYQLAVPIPVPLFFGELGFESLGLEGLGFQTHWSLPAPQLNPADALRLFTSFKRFFTEQDFLLETNSPPQGLDLSLGIGPNFIELPAFLGGKVLGSQSKTTVRASTVAAHLLNAMKTQSLDALLQTVPLEQRVGSEEVRFASLAMQASWLLTTPAELRTLAYPKLALSGAGDVDRVLSVLPAGQDKGLVLFLKGGWNVANVVTLDTCFGLVGTSTGASTGLRIAGKLGELLDVEMQGSVVIDSRAREVFSLQGRSALRMLGEEVFSGDLTVTENRLAIKGKLDLLPRSPLRITGELEGHVSGEGFRLAGGAMVTLNRHFTLGGASAELTHTGARISGTWLDQTVTFEVRKRESGTRLEARLSPIEAGLLLLSNAEGNGGPEAHLELGANPSLSLDASASLLGLSGRTRVSISDAGAHFEVSGKLFNLFEATLVVRGEDLRNAHALSVEATLRNDLLARLRDDVVANLQYEAEKATRDLSEAQRQVEDAQHEVNKLNGQIDEMRRTVQGERDAAHWKLETDTRAVAEAQRQVDTLNDQLAAVRRTIEDERRGATEKFRQAQADVDREQEKVNALLREMESTKAWYYGLPQIDWAHKPNQTREAVPFAAKMGALGTAYGVATGALQLARKVLEGVEGVTNLPPIDADPRMVALFAGRDIATGALTVARETLRLGQQAVQAFPVDADPRIVALFAGRDIATGALTVAQGTLELTKQTVQGGSQVAAWLVQQGVGGLLDVRAARFAASLDAASGGRVSLSAELVFLGNPKSVQFDFDFRDPAKGAWLLAEQLTRAA